jgi:type IV secretion system protein VirB9
MILMSAVTVRAESVPVRGVLDGRIRTARYDADQVYKLTGVVGYAIELVFEEGEHFAGYGGGDLDGVGIDAHDHYVLLKPKAAVVATNLVIYTDRRAYRFDYSVVEHAPRDAMIYAVKFSYPPLSAPGTPTPAERVTAALAAAKTERPRNTDYWYCGAASLKPIAASDDGVQTRLTFADRAELPALFVLNADGSESLLNFSMDAGDVLIHRVAQKFILRRGKLTGCVLNKGFTGSGARLDSGTISPEVERVQRGDPP